MSSAIGRKNLFASSSDNSDSESIDIYKFEENSAASNKNIHCSNSYDFWDIEEGFKGYHSVHEPSVCYSHFVDELNSALNLKLPDYSFESLCRELRNQLQNTIHCSVLELNKAIESCYKAIQNFEDFGIKQGNVFVGKIGFKLLIDDDYPGFGDKKEIPKNFMAVQMKSAKEREFLNLAKDFCSELELKMMNSYNESFKVESLKEAKTEIRCTNYAFIFDLKDYRKHKVLLDMEKGIKWTETKTEILKVQLEKKINDLKGREEEIKLKTSQLEAEKQQFSLEKKEFETSWDNVNLKESQIMQLQTCVNEFLANMSRKGEINSDHYATSSSEIVETFDIEKGNLEKNLEDFEKKLSLAKPEEKDAILTSINFIETRLEGIASDNENIHSKGNPIPAKIKRSMSIKQDCFTSNIKFRKVKESQVAYAPILANNRNSSAFGYNRFNGHNNSKVSPHNPSNKINANSAKSKRYISPIRACPILNQQAVNLELEEHIGHTTKNCIEPKEVKSSLKASKIKVSSEKNSPEKVYDRDKFEVARKRGENPNMRMEEIAKKENLIESKLEELDKKEKELDQKAKKLDIERANLEIEKTNWSNRVESLKNCMQELL